MKMRSDALVTNLVRLAARLRDPLRLAVALRAQYPDWGARATFTAFGLRDLLDHLDWPLDGSLLERFEAYAHELAALHPEPLWALRREQIARLLRAIEQPRELTLRRGSGTCLDRDLDPMLVTCANRGYTLADVRALVDVELGLPRAGLVRACDVEEGPLLASLVAWRSRLGELDVRAYVDLLERADRDHHPDVLRAAALRDLAALGRASTPGPEQRLEASLAELAEHEAEADDPFVTALATGAMQA